MAEASTNIDSEGVPDWLLRYAQEARKYQAQGEVPPLTVEEVAPKDAGSAPKAKGVTPRRRAHGWVYEVRHRGKTVGTYDTFEEAVQAKARAKKT